jgi:hypothetical protein
MKHYLFILLLISGNLVSCRFDHNHSDQTEDKEEVTDQDEQDDKDNDDDERDKKSETDDSKDEDEDTGTIDLKSILGKSFFKDSKKLVSLDELKALFPKEIQGMKRTSLEGDHVGAFGFKMTNVKSEFEQGDENIKFEIIDFGGLTSAISDLAKWSDPNLAHQDDDGYSKMAKWHGYKSFEKDDNRHHESSLAFIYKDRLIVNVKSDEKNLNDLKDITEKNILAKLDKIDLETK